MKIEDYRVRIVLKSEDIDKIENLDQLKAHILEDKIKSFEILIDEDKILLHPKY